MAINFRDLADEFKRRIRNTTFTGTTDVDLIYHLEDANGQPLPPHRHTLVSHVTLRGIEDAKRKALETLQQTAIDNIEALVPNASRELVGIRGVAVPVRILRFELDIRDDAV